MKSFNKTLIINELVPLDLTNTPSYSPEILKYFNIYNLDFGATHYFGSFQSQSFVCAAHVFDPHEIHGTAFLFHGFYDHTGILKNIIKLCIRERLRVAVFDFPGHGLSTGNPAAIDHFSQYAMAAKDFFGQIKPLSQPPYYLIAHSMGGAVALECLYQQELTAFKKIILCAPLVRCSYYFFSRFGYFFMSPLVQHTPRWFRRASADKEFLKFFRADPLQYKRFPVQWARAYYHWLGQIKKYEFPNIPLTIIQGTNDDVVDWQYNIPFIKLKMPWARTYYIKESHHQLMNEIPLLLKQFFTILQQQIRNP